MVVNKHGDLELYAIHDTPKQLAWSSRGSFTLGAGLGLKVIEGYNDSESEDDIESEDAPVNKYTTSQDKARRSRSRSVAPSRAGSRPRGRDASIIGARLSAIGGLPPLFGRGDDDGFPALSSRPTGLSATRPGQPRTYSPASIRNFRSSERGEPSALHRRSLSRTGTLPVEEPSKDPSLPLEHRKTDRVPKMKEVKKQGVLHIVQDDIAMIMRHRAKAGYGLSQVGIAFPQSGCARC